MTDWSRCLCEGCGYELGEYGDGVCPECGRERALSDPARRVGSPWQRGEGVVGGVVGAISTVWLVLRGGGSLFELVRVDRWRGALLVPVYGGMAGLVVWFGIALSSMGGEFRSWVTLVGMVVEGVLICGGLSLVEYVGLRMIGRRHGYRIGHRVAGVVVGHASAGWVGGGIVAAVGWNVGLLLPSTVRQGVYSSGVWDLGVLSYLYPTLRYPEYLMVLLGLLVGLLWFEVLAYLGIRRCRWANAV